MSELPKLAGQSCSGAGRGTLAPVRSDIRQASIAGQSAALRASFHTAAPQGRELSAQSQERAGVFSMPTSTLVTPAPRVGNL